MDTKLITLSSKHVDFADKLARRRCREAFSGGFKPGNNAPTDWEEALKLDIQGARGETAAYLYLSPVKWNLYNPSEADFEGWVDAKCQQPSLIIQKKAKDHWAYLLVHHDHPDYYLMGWEWGVEAKRPELLKDPLGNREAFFVPPDDELMKPVEELVELIRWRQGHPRDCACWQCVARLKDSVVNRTFLP
jgi:hypothetical protein